MGRASIDINCDMGESYGNFNIGKDVQIMPHISSCSIACGFHAGDPITIDRTIDLAIQYAVRIGAHPSYPDLVGFGRRSMHLSEKALYADLRYQIAALKSLVESKGISLSYVKVHGALYNDASKNLAIAETIAAAIKSVDPRLAMMGLANSQMKTAAKIEGISFISEAFGDRRYISQSALASRSSPEAVINEASKVADQVKSIILENKINTISGKIVEVVADSICIHGDHTGVLENILQIEATLKTNNITIQVEH